jgi:hypothetical protein
VEVEVGPGDGGNGADGERHGIEPVLGQPLGRGFEDRPSVAGVDHMTQQALDARGLGCRPLGLVPGPLLADPPLQRPDQSRPLAGGAQDPVDQEGSRGLAVSPGHADAVQA